MKYVPFLFSLSLFSPLLSGKTLSADVRKGPVYRKDLAAFFTKFLCKNKKNPGIEEFWKAGIWDAGMHLRILESEKSGLLSTGKLRTMARSQAVRERGASFSFGVCHEERGWIVSSPAPGPVRIEKGNLCLTPGHIRRDCKTWSLDFAPARQGAAQNMARGTGKEGPACFPLNPAPGTTSLTCYPGTPEWAGPGLWYLVPDKPVQAALLPVLVPDGTKQTGRALKDWINRIRLHHGMQPLRFGQKPLQAGVGTLGLSSSLKHDRRLLRQVYEDLEKSGYTDSGENRASGRSPADLANLMWMSPRHRALLLKKDATDAAVSWDPGSGLMILLISRKITGPLAKKNQYGVPAR